MDELQLQKKREAKMEEKLDKIASLLEVLVKMQEEEIYPPESKMKRSFIRECQRILKEIKLGSAKTHTYKNMAEFSKAVG